MKEDKSCEGDLFCGVNKPKNPAQMTDLEKKHTPVIEAPDVVKKGEMFNVTVEVGKLMKHPNEAGHYIEFIELYAGDTFLTRVDLIPERTAPKITIPISLTHAHPLRAFERCNLHGTWEGTKEIKVE
ncbi:class II SORL domain-containing protein [Candidatus Hecatella orcuttiae]|uniref:class II SORL domain-containing protein n=1 Tax=Candidatus Hecatella orcuttiae TaxID=1935119 RepID=UPI002867CEA6|nr:class II SORL domain-containing protein [Candidatus Hecatella orcuttiae]